MRKTDKAWDPMLKGDLFQVLYRATFGEVQESSRYIRINPKNKSKFK
jgi:hypothetical protein